MGACRQPRRHHSARRLEAAVLTKHHAPITDAAADGDATHLSVVVGVGVSGEAHTRHEGAHGFRSIEFRSEHPLRLADWQDLLAAGGCSTVSGGGAQGGAGQGDKNQLIAAYEHGHQQGARDSAASSSYGNMLEQRKGEGRLRLKYGHATRLTEVFVQVLDPLVATACVCSIGDVICARTNTDDEATSVSDDEALTISVRRTSKWKMGWGY